MPLDPAQTEEPVYNPYTGEIVGSVAVGDAAAMERARAERAAAWSFSRRF